MMQLTLSLNRRAHLFIKDDKLFMRVDKPCKNNPDKHFSAMQSMPIDDIKKIHTWTAQALAAMGKSSETPKPDVIDDVPFGVV